MIDLDGPLYNSFKKAFENTQGVVKQEFTTYRVKQGTLVKETVSRYFYDVNKFHDTATTEVLAKGVE